MLIDACTHITQNGRWFDTGLDASEDTLLRNMDGAGIEKAAIIGLPQVATNDFILGAWKRHPDRFIPVGSVNPAAYPDTSSVISAAREQLGASHLVGVKLHPRFGRYDLLDPRVTALLEEISQWQSPPIIWICTFLHYQGGRLRKPPVETFHELVGSYPQLRFVLLHGGGPDLLRLATALRDMPNAYLDISYTMTRFRGSSVETDLSYLINTFDRRLLYGSDYPEISLMTAKHDFADLATKAKPGAAEYLGRRNLETILRGRQRSAETS